jgi:hypothetical protein
MTHFAHDIIQLVGPRKEDASVGRSVICHSLARRHDDPHWRPSGSHHGRAAEGHPWTGHVDVGKDQPYFGLLFKESDGLLCVRSFVHIEAFVRQCMTITMRTKG